ncbi:MAG: hypothetical protein AUJ12_03595 [Alphaproteobacteria bacterium CG1_02_46_17]|nr:MAG: hypothetical protein AUJ12_03595 [Alphaproteobacteria bacterium CG1_02_46_17]
MSKKPYYIYLSGPDVFTPNAIEHGRKLSDIVRTYGHCPLFPLDNEIVCKEDNLSREIFESNLAMIRKADLVVANLNEFRGHEPDSGTVWEIGYAAALNKIIIGYCDDHSPMAQRIMGEDNCFHDRDGWAIENFGLPLNLMLVHGCHSLVCGDLVSAMEFIKENL